MQSQNAIAEGLSGAYRTSSQNETRSLCSNQNAIAEGLSGAYRTLSKTQLRSHDHNNPKNAL